MNASSISFIWNSSLREIDNLTGVDIGLGRSPETALCLNSHSNVSATPKFYEGESSKKKKEISLDLDLGCSGISSRSKTNLTSPDTFATSGSSSSDFSLDFNLNLGTKWPYNDKHFSAGTKPPENEMPKVNLELSLSTGCVVSDVTSVSIHQLVDEGSTSSKWKHGALVARVDRLQATEAKGDNDHQVATHFNFPSLAVEPAKVDDPSTVLSRQPRRTTGKPCQFPGCHKGARGASGRCISHGGSRRCQRPDCQKGAEGKTPFCKAHGGGRRCEYAGCTKSAEGRTNLCIAHGGGRRCTYSGGCNHAARGKSGLCIRHGGGKRCRMENCTKSAEGQSVLCIAHGGGRRCQYPQCSKGAQGSTRFCKAHGGGKRCTFTGCTKGAEGSTLFCKGHGGGKRCSYEGGGVCTKSVHGGTLYCVSHGGGKRCIAPECTKSARGRTNFCVRHGGGKRCQFEGCGKSAQGSTDFCKAHGGGKHCLWGQPGSSFGEDGVDAPCDKFARGKFGLCAGHAAQVQDKRVHGEGTVGLKMIEIAYETCLELGNNVTGEEISRLCNGFTFKAHGPRPEDYGPPSEDRIVTYIPGESSNSASLPEGRVHGGSLMAMLRGNYISS